MTSSFHCGIVPRWRALSIPSRLRANLRCLAAFVLLTCAPYSLSQSSGSAAAAISGSVHDAHQHAVANASITLQAASSAPALSVSTNDQGAYRIEKLQPGTYTLRAEHPASGSATYGPVELRAGDQRSIDLTLTKAGATGSAPSFFDQPNFTVAGVSETSGAGGHGSDTVRRKTEDLTKATASLGGTATTTASPDNRSVEQRAQDLRQSIAQNDRADLHHQLAALEEQAGDPLTAVREYQKAAEMDPSESNLFDWGTELLIHRATEPAIEIFTRGHRLFPTSVRMLMAMGVGEFARGSYDLAATRLCQASDLDPANPAPYLFLGKMQDQNKATSADALARFARFAQLEPNNAAASYYYAVALWNRRQGDNDTQAFAHVADLLHKSISIDPAFAPAYLQIGVLESTREHWSQAAEAYQQAIQANPSLEEAHYRLAQSYRRMGKKKEAEDELAIYERLSQSTDERVNRERKAVLQFVYQFRTPAPDVVVH